LMKLATYFGVGHPVGCTRLHHGEQITLYQHKAKCHFVQTVEPMFSFGRENTPPHALFDIGIKMRYTATHYREGSPMRLIVFLLFWYVIPTTSFECIDQLCIRRIAIFRSQATMESGFLCVHSHLC
jgi:hypothetical protein